MAKSNDYKNCMIEMVTDAGKYLQDHADDIVGNLRLMRDFEIVINFNDYSGVAFCVPEITIRQTHLVSKRLGPEVTKDGR